ncbi:MAG: hypothetical protein CW338_00030 [Clostridiales bacterium]|nr:hypothetical protein [Clostridiales bacterium]
MAGSFDKLKNSARRMFDRFFFEGEAQDGAEYQEEDRAPRQGQPYQPVMSQAEEGGEPVFTQQTAYPPQPVYQTPPQQTYQQPQQAYQPPQEQRPAPAFSEGGANPYAPQSGRPVIPSQFSMQNEPQPRSRRARREDNVVQFPTETPPQNTYFKPDPAPAQNAERGANPPAGENRPLYQSSYQPGGAQNGPVTSIRIMSIRNILDCRAAITLLRQGDMVLVTMESVGDANEMRRFVDTLSGACFSLTSTITKVSRYGTYLLAPVSMGVFCDSAVSQMNSAARPRPQAQPQPQPQEQRPAPRQAQVPPVYQPQGRPNEYAFGGAQQQYAEYMPPQPAYQPQPQPAPQQFYARPAQQEARRPVFEQQPAGYGYAPDREEDEAAQ